MRRQHQGGYYPETMSKVKASKVLLGLGLSAALGIQLIPVEHSNPPVESDLFATPEVKAVLKRSCYACHSNETPWPWYGHVAPISWLFNEEVLEGRSEMNFSTWKKYRLGERSDYFEDMIEQVKSKEKPPWYFRLIDPSIQLSTREIEMLSSWAAENVR